jgi:hypothetical protein
MEEWAFTHSEFVRRLRVNRRVYDKVKSGLLQFDPEFCEQKPDAAGPLSATTDQKLCVALRLSGQGVGADSVVEVSRLS